MLADMHEMFEVVIYHLYRFIYVSTRYSSRIPGNETKAENRRGTAVSFVLTRNTAVYESYALLLLCSVSHNDQVYQVLLL